MPFSAQPKIKSKLLLNHLEYGHDSGLFLKSLFFFFSPKQSEAL